MLIWSSRSLLPVALAGHLVIAWTMAPHGVLVVLATLLAPGVAEVALLGWFGWSSSPGHVVRLGALALAGLVLLLGLGMIAMSSGEGAPAEPARTPRRP